MGRKVNLINGNFITLDDQCPFAEMISVENGKIAGINAADHNCKTLDLQGATVIPGFTDAHFHLVNLGKQMDTLQLRDYSSAKEIAETKNKLGLDSDKFYHVSDDVLSDFVYSYPLSIHTR